jgi:hypothetical protein
MLSSFAIVFVMTRSTSRSSWVLTLASEREGGDAIPNKGQKGSNVATRFEHNAFGVYVCPWRAQARLGQNRPTQDSILHSSLTPFFCCRGNKGQPLALAPCLRNSTDLASHRRPYSVPPAPTRRPGVDLFEHRRMAAIYINSYSDAELCCRAIGGKEPITLQGLNHHGQLQVLTGVVRSVQFGHFRLPDYDWRVTFRRRATTDSGSRRARAPQRRRPVLVDLP